MRQNQSLNQYDFQLIQRSQTQITPARLQNVEYRCQIINNIIQIQLLQTFRTESGSDNTDALYYFPTDDNVCLESFEAKYNDQTIKGIVKEIQQPRQQCGESKNQDNIVSYARLPKNLDQDYVHIKLGNLPPNEQVEIALKFSQQLGCKFNKYYIAQIPLLKQQDDVSVNLEKNILTLDLICTGRIIYSECISSVTQKTLIDENTVRFQLSQENYQQNQNFQIIFSFEGMFDPQLIFGSTKCYHEDKVKRSIQPLSHSAMITYTPNFNENIINEIDDSIKAALANGEDITNDEFQQRMNIERVDHLNSSRSEFIFLLDRSASMNWTGISKAREALIFFLKTLPNDSYFNVISFGSEIQKLFPESLKYTTDNLRQAVEIISKYQADLGSTEIYYPLADIFETEKIKGFNKQIFLLTDGQASNPQEIVDLIKKNNKYNRVHCIGFGSGADQYLINKGAIAGKGYSKIVDFSCDLSEIIIQMLQSCITPTLDDFTILYDQSIIDSTYPSTTDSLCVFKDEIINIHFFFKPLVDISKLTQEQKKLQIKYFDSHKQQEIEKEINLEMSNNFICNSELQESIFKIGKQLYLNGNIKTENTNSDLIQQAVDFQLLTENTTLISVIESQNDIQKVIFNHYCDNKINEQQQSDIDIDDNILLSLSEYTSTEEYSCRKRKRLRWKKKKQPRNYFFSEAASESISPEREEQQEQQQQIKEDKKRRLKKIYFEEAAEESEIGEVEDQQQEEEIEQKKIIAHSKKYKKIFCEEAAEESEEDYGKEEQQQQQQFGSKVDQLNEQKQLLLKPKMSFIELCNLLDSQGICKYDQKLIEELGGLDVVVIQQFAMNFSEKDAFMTLFILAVFELFFKEEKLKWALISKKSLNSIKKYCRSDINSLKESLLSEIKK